MTRSSVMPFVIGPFRKFLGSVRCWSSPPSALHSLRVHKIIAGEPIPGTGVE